MTEINLMGALQRSLENDGRVLVPVELLDELTSIAKGQLAQFENRRGKAIRTAEAMTRQIVEAAEAILAKAGK
jgi:hypothetical protein